MGEAKQRAAARASKHASVDAKLTGLGVDTSLFGFYDQAAFVAAESKDPEFLEYYALWVQSRPRTADYDARVRAIVPRLASLLANLFESQDMQRSCVHASSMMPRILDRLGVWSFGVRGSLAMEVPGRKIWRGQSFCDIAHFEGAELGHAWIVAPPYVIVDPTIRLQNPPGDAICPYIPDIVAVEDAPLVKPRIEDVVSTKIRAIHFAQEGYDDPQLHHVLLPKLREFGRDFPAREMSIGELALRYVPVGVRASDVGLEEINVDGEKLTGLEVWNDHIFPAFGEFVVETSK